jgi:hypothetical protein
MNLHFPINTAARFLWQEPDGTMRMCVGTTLDISRSGVTITASSVPSPGTEVQVIVDLPALKVGGAAGRFMGKGMAVRVGYTDGRASGFEAEVKFQIIPASQLPVAESAAVNHGKREAPVRAYKQRHNPAANYDIAAARVAYGGLDEVSGQVQLPAA